MEDSIVNESQEAYERRERAYLPSLVKSPEGLKMVTAWAVASDKSVVACALFEAMTTDLRPKLTRIKTPTTVLYPWDASTDGSQAAVDAIYQENFAALPNKTMIRVDGSYHFIMLDQPDFFIRQVDKFLEL